MFSALFVLLMALANRCHGSGSWPGIGRPFSYLVTFIAFAAGNYMLLGVTWLAVVMGLLSCVGLASGHGRFYAMNGANINDPNPEWIETAIAQNLYYGDITKPAYSWLCMGIKGAIVGLAIFPFGALLAILWPASYYIGTRYFNGDTAPAEWLRGVCCGLLLILTFII